MNRGLNVTGSVSSLSPRGTSGERAGERGIQTKTAASPPPPPPPLLPPARGRGGGRAGERGIQTKTASSPRPSPPSFLRRRGRSRRFMVPRHAQKRIEAFHEPRSSGRESAHLSSGKVRADSRRLLRFSPRQSQIQFVKLVVGLA